MSDRHMIAAMSARDEDAELVKAQTRKFTPANCPHCEYDRRFPGFEEGGWMRMDNNGPIVSCPLCNQDGAHPRQ